MSPPAAPGIIATGTLLHKHMLPTCHTGKAIRLPMPKRDSGACKSHVHPTCVSWLKGQRRTATQAAASHIPHRQRGNASHHNSCMSQRRTAALMRHGQHCATRSNGARLLNKTSTSWPWCHRRSNPTQGTCACIYPGTWRRQTWHGSHHATG